MPASRTTQPLLIHYVRPFPYLFYGRYEDLEG